jgi:hypothetical protein
MASSAPLALARCTKNLSRAETQEPQLPELLSRASLSAYIQPCFLMSAAAQIQK